MSFVRYCVLLNCKSVIHVNLFFFFSFFYCCYLCFLLNGIKKYFTSPRVCQHTWRAMSHLLSFFSFFSFLFSLLFSDQLHLFEGYATHCQECAHNKTTTTTTKRGVGGGGGHLDNRDRKDSMCCGYVVVKQAVPVVCGVQKV